MLNLLQEYACYLAEVLPDELRNWSLHYNRKFRSSFQNLSPPC